jgi:predicted nucleic acid-binding protein
MKTPIPADGPIHKFVAMDYAEHALPFTACTSFVVMREYGLTDALTRDRPFRMMGFRPLLAD